MRTTCGRWIVGAAILVTTNIAAAAGWAVGYIGDFGYDGSRSLWVSIDSVKQYNNRYDGTLETPYVDLNYDNECQDPNVAMLNLADPAAADKNVIIMLLTTAESLKKPVGIETAGCVTLSGTTYPRIMSVWYQ